MLSRGFKGVTDLVEHMEKAGVPKILTHVDQNSRAKASEYGALESTGRASSWALSSCTIRFMLSQPTPYLQQAIDPYLETFRTHRVVGMHIRVGFLFREGGADSGGDTHVVPAMKPADAPEGGSVWDKLDDFVEEGNAKNPSYKVWHGAIELSVIEWLRVNDKMGKFDIDIRPWSSLIY
jgi:hypothetical protein